MELNYWNGQSFGLDMKSAILTAEIGQLISQVTLTRTSTAAVPASIGTSLAESMRVAIGA